MDSNEILDWDALSALGLMPEKGEKILWAGQPKMKPFLRGTRRITRAWMAYYALLIFNFQRSYALREIFPALINFAAIALVQAIPYYVMRHKLQRTAYVVTDRRIVLRLWRWFREKVYVLRYDDFQKSTYNMEYPGTNWGTVYLMTGKDVGFWTHSIETDERRHHPTLECVEDAENLAIAIEKQRRQLASHQV